MKKLICLILTLLFLCPTAFAEVPAEETPEFTFRNGIRWGMTPEQVRAAEGREADDFYPTRDSVDILEFYDVPVSRFTSDLVYIFVNDTLYGACYCGFDTDYISASCHYLNGALSSVYGNPVPVEPDVINQFMIDISDGNNTGNFGDSLEWHAADDTKIWLTFYGDYDIYIFYVSPEFDASLIGTYDITGL